MPKEPQPTPDAVGQSSIRSIEEALSIAEDAVTFTSDAKSRLSKRIKKTDVKVLTDGYFNDNVNSYNAFNPNNGFHDDDSHVDSETNVNYAKDVEYIFVH